MRRRYVTWGIVGLVVALVVFGVVRGLAGKRGHEESAGKTGRGGPVPVSAQAASSANVPIYLQGIGTVQASQAATVRTRVDGELQQVAFKEGQEVKQGDLLAVIDPRTFQAALDQARAKKLQDQAALVSARKDLARYQTLVEQKLQQSQTLDQQAATVGQLEAAVQGDAAQADSARVQLSYTRITAPFAGRVGLRLVDVGNIVHASDATGLVSLTQLTPIAVLFTLPEANVGVINAELTRQEHLKVEALAADNSTVVATGELVVVDNQIDATTGTVRLKALFANENRALWPGQFVNARLLLRTRENATVVPAPAIQRGPDTTFVYVLENDTAQVRPVKVAQVQAGLALIDEGVQPGEQVVTDGQYKLQPGSKVVLQGGGNKGGGPHAAPAAVGGAGNAGSNAAPQKRAQESRRLPESR